MAANGGSPLFRHQEPQPLRRRFSVLPHIRGSHLHLPVIAAPPDAHAGLLQLSGRHRGHTHFHDDTLPQARRAERAGVWWGHGSRAGSNRQALSSSQAPQLETLLSGEMVIIVYMHAICTCTLSMIMMHIHCSTHTHSNTHTRTHTLKYTHIHARTHAHTHT